MTSKQVSVGDKFKLLGKEFYVSQILDDKEYLYADVLDDVDQSALRWPLSEADALEWIVPEVRFTKEQAEAIEGWIMKNRFWHNQTRGEYGVGQVQFEDWLSDHTS